jgi:hypothetical protein
MKIITLWQPWASLVAIGLKVHETRSWSTTYRGPLAIHAAKRPVDGVGLGLLDFLELCAYEEGRHIELPCAPFVYGSIVAVVDLVSVGPSYTTAPTHSLDLVSGDWGHGRFAWELENVRRCEVPWKGAQGLRTLPEEALALIEATQ